MVDEEKPFSKLLIAVIVIILFIYLLVMVGGYELSNTLQCIMNCLIFFCPVLLTIGLSKIGKKKDGVRRNKILPLIPVIIFGLLFAFGIYLTMTWRWKLEHECLDWHTTCEPPIMLERLFLIVIGFMFISSLITYLFILFGKNKKKL